MNTRACPRDVRGSASVRMGTMDKSLNIAKRDNDSYSAAFETPEGRLTCVISVARQEGASDRRTPGEKKEGSAQKAPAARRRFLDLTFGAGGRKGLISSTHHELR